MSESFPNKLTNITNCDIKAFTSIFLYKLIHRDLLRKECHFLLLYAKQHQRHKRVRLNYHQIVLRYAVLQDFIKWLISKDKCSICTLYKAKEHCRPVDIIDIPFISAERCQHLPNTQLWSTCFLVMLIYIIFASLTAWEYWDRQQWGWGRGWSRSTRVGWSRQDIWAVGRDRWDWWGGVPESYRWNQVVQGGHRKTNTGVEAAGWGLGIGSRGSCQTSIKSIGPPFGCSYGGFKGCYHSSCSFAWYTCDGHNFHPIPSDTCLSSPTPTPGPSTLTNTSTSVTPDTDIASAQDIPTSQWTASRVNVDGMHKYKCSGCDVVQTMRNAVLSHIRVVHTKTELGPCPHCGQFTLTNNDSYRWHVYQCGKD